MCLGKASYIDSDLFVGRTSELEEMKKTLVPARRPAVQQQLILGGVGGIGKTQLAIAYAKCHCDVYESSSGLMLHQSHTENQFPVCSETHHSRTWD